MRIAFYKAMCRACDVAWAQWVADYHKRGTFIEVRLYYTYRILWSIREAAYKLAYRL